MQVILNSSLNRVNSYYINKRKAYDNYVSSPNIASNNGVIFTGAPVVTKTVTSKIALEKSKFLRHFKDILATNIPEKTEEDIMLAMIARAHSLIDKLEKRQQEISDEMDAIIESKLLNPKQKYDAGKKLMNELNRLNKINPFEKPKTQPKKTFNDDYDYVLINKFKNSVMNDDYDLAKVFKEHYAGLMDINTIEELKEKYPTIKVPKTPKEVITQKIIDVIPRLFYEELDNLFQSDDRDVVAKSLAEFYENFFTELAPVFKMDSAEELFKLIGESVAQKSVSIYHELVEKGSMSSIPETRKTYVPNINNIDRQLLHIDFDKLVLHTLREQYLEGKNLTDIIYKEGDAELVISSLKDSDYKFAKLPEKIKRFIIDSEKIKLAQRDYQKFTSEELNARLNYYTNTEFGNNEKLLELFVDFDSCKYTEEDKQYLIKFLQILDKIADGEMTFKEGLEYIELNNIKPHGTVKLDEIERRNLEEKIKLEQQKAVSLNILRNRFTDSINKLYEYNLSNVAEEFMGFYPESSEDKLVKSAEQVIEIVEESLKLQDSRKVKNSILRWKIYNEYAKNPANTALLEQAREYGRGFDGELKQRAGQYLLNRELLNNYPASKDFFTNPEIAKRIVEKFGDDINLATLYLCKYENYKMLNPTEQQYISKILEIFDHKNVNDRVLLKNIIENDYINSETRVNNVFLNKEIVIAPSAKQGILGKYKFPTCIDLFLAFEDAMSLSATKQGTAGVKKIEGAGKAGTHQIELKIMGYPDRLFSNNNDYNFDIYSEKGLH